MATVIAGDVPITIKVDNGDKLATVALVVSVVALIATILQVLQQYYASAVGYSNCDEKVMGMWHKSKQRLVRIEELRFEVRFEAPVIFVAPPTNKRGPVPDKPIYTIDGSPESQRDTRAQIDRDDHGGGRRLTAKEQKDREKDSIHTADNERATWVNMLLALQRMEKESMEWQAREFALNPPTGRRLAGRETHTLAVQVQRKLRSWDTMPSNVKKPYATTTFCHLIEMTAMLGLHWKEFDRSHDRYRAEGNGFLISGGHVSDLGIMFTFHISAKSHFEENRVIPVDEVKELCFGYVPTIFGRDDRKDSAGGAGVRRIEEPEKAHARDDVDDDVDGAAGGALGLADLPESRELLRLGSFTEIAETLTLLKCNQNTVNYFAHGKAAKHVHLFSGKSDTLGAKSSQSVRSFMATLAAVQSLMSLVPSERSNPACSRL